jgi:hypothetical protein
MNSVTSSAPAVPRNRRKELSPLDNTIDTDYLANTEDLDPLLFPDDDLRASTAPRHSEQVNTRTALFAAFAKREGMFSDESLASAVDRYTTELRMGGEDALRESIGRAQRSDEVNAIRDVQSNYMLNPVDYEAEVTLQGLVDAEFELDSSPVNPNTLESEGIAAMQDMAMAEPTQGAILQELIDTRQVSAMHAQAFKYSLIDRELDALNIELEDHTVLGHVLDAFTVPTDYFRSFLGTVPGNESSWTQTPWFNLKTEIETLFNKPIPEFERDLPIFIENLRSQSGWLAENISQVQHVLSTYRAGVSDRDLFNWTALGAFDASGVMELGGLAAIRGVARTATHLGNRAGGARANATTIVADSNNLGPNANGIGTSVNPVDAIQDSLPGIMKPDRSMDGAVGTSGDIASEIGGITSLAGKVRRIIANRLAPAQRDVAIQQAIRQVGDEFRGDVIYDIKPGEGHWSISPDVDAPPVPRPDTRIPPSNVVFEVQGKPFSAEAISEASETTLVNRLRGSTQIEDSNVTFEINGKALSAEKIATSSIKALTQRLRQGLSRISASNVSTTANGKTLSAEHISARSVKELAQDLGYSADWQGWARAQALKDSMARHLDEAVVPNFTSLVEQARALKRAAARHLNESIVPDDASLLARARELKDSAARHLNEVSTPMRKRTPTLTNMNWAEVGNDPADFDALVQKSIDEETDLSLVHIHLGRNYGKGGYATRKAALQGAARRGLSGPDVTIVQSQGQHFIRVARHVDETGVALPATMREDLPPIRAHRITQYLKDPMELLSDKMAALRQQVVLERANIEHDIIRPLIKYFKVLNKNERKSLSKVLIDGRRAEKWYSEGEFAAQYMFRNKRPPTNKEIDAYKAYRVLNDVEYNIRNSLLYTAKARSGWMTGSIQTLKGIFNVPRTNVKNITDPDFDTLRVYDAETDIHHKGGTNTADLKAKMDTGQYRVLQLETPAKHNKEHVQYVLVSKKDSSIGPLERNQLNYVAGGHRENRFKYFVKQGVRKSFADGEQYWLNDFTHIAARSQVQAQQWADGMNEAVRIFKDQGLTEAQKRILIQSTPVEDYDKFKSMLDDAPEMLDDTTPFEVVFDEAPTKARSQLGVDDAQIWGGAMNGDEGYMASKGRMYYSHRRNEALRDPDDLEAEVLDPWKTISKSMANIVRSKALTDYNIKFIEEWARMAVHTGMVDPARYNGPADMFFNGVLRSGASRVDNLLYQQLEANRAVHKRFMRFRTPEMTNKEMVFRNIAEFIDGNSKGRQKWSQYVLDVASSNPLEAVRAFTFHTTLGMFDPGQLFIQTQQAFLAMSLSPTAGFQAFMNTRMMLHLNMNRSPNLLDMYATRMDGVHGFTKDEFKTMVTSWRQSGWNLIGGHIPELDSLANNVGGSRLRQTGHDFLNSARWFFDNAERINRMVAYQLAWKDTAKKFPNLATGSKEFLEAVDLQTGVYNFSMTTANKSGWQEGFMSIPTQFLSWMFRMSERMLPKALGGNRRITAAQRGRLWGASMLLYGTAGVPFGEYGEDHIKEAYKSMTGEDLSEAAWRGISRGLIDTGLASLGMDTDWASRAGVGEGIGDTVAKLTDGNLSSFLEVAGGASASIGIDVFDNLKAMARLAHAEQVDIANQPRLEQMGTRLFVDNISSLGRAQRAYWIWSLGQLKDPQTGQRTIEANVLEGWAALMGVPLNKEQEQWAAIGNAQDRAEYVRGLAELIVKNRREAAYAQNDRNERRFREHTELATGLTTAHRDDPLLMDEIIAEVNKQMGYTNSTYYSVMTRQLRQTGELPIGAEIEN